MQRCSSRLPCLLPPSPLLSRGCDESSMRGNEKRGSYVLYWGSCAALLLFLSSLLSHLFYTPQLVLLFIIMFLHLTSFSSSCFFELPSRTLAENSYTFGFVRACEFHSLMSFLSSLRKIVSQRDHCPIIDPAAQCTAGQN